MHRIFLLSAFSSFLEKAGNYMLPCPVKYVMLQDTIVPAAGFNGLF
ncbi:hypothetical protein [Pedobacter sp. NJ-S-72]